MNQYKVKFVIISDPRRILKRHQDCQKIIDNDYIRVK